MLIIIMKGFVCFICSEILNKSLTLYIDVTACRVKTSNKMFISHSDCRIKFVEKYLWKALYMLISKFKLLNVNKQSKRVLTTLSNSEGA